MIMDLKLSDTKFLFARVTSIPYSLELANCDGPRSSFSTYQQSDSNQFPYLELHHSGLPWGSNVYAKVIGYNQFGDSAISVAGNEAVILTYPDAPESLAEVINLRSSTSIQSQSS